MFADVDAINYVLVDGDATYDAAALPHDRDAEKPIISIMVVGFRVDQRSCVSARARTGNWMLTRFLSSLFRQEFKDILSGYRVFSRRFVKTFPVLSDGFEIETELSVHALELALPVAKSRRVYRPEGSFTSSYLARRLSYPRHHPEAVFARRSRCASLLPSASLWR